MSALLRAELKRPEPRTRSQTVCKLSETVRRPAAMNDLFVRQREIISTVHGRPSPTISAAGAHVETGEIQVVSTGSGVLRLGRRGLRSGRE